MGKGKGKGAYYKARYGGGGSHHRDYREPTEPLYKRSKMEESSSEDDSELAQALIRLEGYSYGYYKDLVGEWQMPNDEWKIFIDRVQSDPYAPPSQIRLRVSMSASKIPSDLWRTPLRSIACCDYITRHFHRTLNDDGLTRAQRGGGWSGSKGGDVQITNPGQQVLQRSCMFICPEYIEARCTLALPARGRTIEGYKAAEIIHNLWPLVRASLYYDRLDQKALKAHVDSVDDQGWVVYNEDLKRFFITLIEAPTVFTTREVFGSPIRPSHKQEAAFALLRLRQFVEDSLTQVLLSNQA
ncbi:hypothetical protein Pmar_PMAR004353 [Perkinsus marinus ATCC 50983]|uniref:ATPase of the ABC class N-terminal domain-containing protein n=1 Tax=Perkinsus marinus (strain ATCC 50983 / TXsc) TaxID=423536 RepID=C5KMI6_PERM5|nr:hypothetical protein Pmar_PMAR004353 [Perkinsus marinus ATCC 50983]EER14307.1 hypothetical protein Pmar_PMAR004353 [Perkinsus marinus ATCC 50983]|eukprot:XP_002782512.1 hypothetical protein Pmar_PMAR004353 [Perkinsus marinus ATCC 50983]